MDIPGVNTFLCYVHDVNHHHHHHHHHHMALQPNSGPGLPFWGFVTTFLRGWIVTPAPNPQPGGPGLRIYDPQGQGVPAIPPGTAYPF
jgi:hypothetical protein